MSPNIKITYDGQDLENVVTTSGGDMFIVENTKGRQFADVDYDTTNIGIGREYYTDMGIKSREIKVDANAVDSNQSLFKILENLNNALYRTEDVPITFSDEPDRTYYGRFTNADANDGYNDVAQFTLTFLCLDPYKYGRSITQSLSNTTIANGGTVETYPVFDLEVTKQTSLVSIKNYDDQDEEGTPREMVLGVESEADDKEVNTKKLVMQDTMQSTSGWTQASNIDSGSISGNMTTDEDGFYADKWGDESSKSDTHWSDDNNLGDWVGPSLERSLDNPIQDSFTLEALIENQNDKNPDGSPVGEAHTGIMEIYMRDINDNMIAKIQFGDTYGNKVQNKAAFEKGRVDALGEKRWDFTRKGWNDFDGKLYVKRDTDDFIVEASVDNGNGEYVKRKSLRSRPIAEGGTQDRNPLKTIQVAIRKYNGSMRMYNRIKQIKLYDSIGEFDYLLDDDTTPVQFNQGDKIKIDMSNNKILLNGDPQPNLLHFDAEYFSLVEGLNNLKLSNNIKGTVTYRNRYL
ncbi:hypothetical protein GCM10028778_11700 [Barrientosiimonas marina]|uniref:Distal tail protein Dit n=1 Tax=Lentibacillus kimchii TaxID=1542911 RepID=A0ABW2UWP0_9BACI